MFESLVDEKGRFIDLFEYIKKLKITLLSEFQTNTSILKLQFNDTLPLYNHLLKLR
jgi:hypothetical protein